MLTLALAVVLLSLVGLALWVRDKVRSSRAQFRIVPLPVRQPLSRKGVPQRPARDASGRRDSRVIPVPVAPNGDNRVVGLDNTPLQIKQGWQKTGNSWSGYYRTRHGAWKGLIERKGDKFRVYIKLNPPIRGLKSHPREMCFYRTSKPGFDREIKLALNPKDREVSSIIFYVEQIICESFAMA